MEHAIMKSPTPQQIKDFRARYGLTQRAIAERLGITVVAFAHYEQGRRACPGDRWQLVQIMYACPDLYAKAMERIK